jgi:histidine ammonia-lyase
VAAAHAAVRARVTHLDVDRPPSPDIAAVRELVHSGDLLVGGATQRAHA